MDSCPEWHAQPLDADAAPARVLSLAKLHTGARGRVSHIAVDPVDSAPDDARAAIARRLLELGFIPGEQIEVIGESRPGGDPMAVRIGTSMFALRRREAHAVQVQVDRT